MSQRVAKCQSRAHQSGGKYSPCSQGKVCSQEKKRNILEIMHHLEAREEVNAMPAEQARIHKHEIRVLLDEKQLLYGERFI
jgi:hypothetical protein